MDCTRAPSIIFAFLWSAVLGPQLQSEVLPVWVSGGAFQNDLGGLFGVFRSPGCDVRLSLAGHVLRADYDNRSHRACGVFMHLFDERDSAAPGPPVDLGRYPRLFMRFRGSGDPRILLSDPRLLRADDSRAISSIGESAGPPDPRGWREVSLTLDHVRLDTRQASSLAFEFGPGTSGYLEIDWIVFAQDPHPSIPQVASNLRRPGTRSPRAMWYWEFGEAISEPRLWRQVIEFARAHGVRDVYAQIPYQCASPSDAPRCELTNRSALRRTLAEATAAGIAVHALDGAPEFAVSRNHPSVLSVVRDVLDYNESSAPESRFRGIHLDIEPYLLLAFESRRRPEILRQYLALHRDVARVIHEQAPGLEFGADLPFWYDEGPNLTLDFNGKRQDVSKHLIDIVDTAVLMDYRNAALGADGLIRHAAGEIAYATARGRRVMVGVETLPQQPETIVFLAGLPEGWLDRASESLVFERLIGGFRLRVSSDPTHRFVGLAANEADINSERFRSALMEVARLAGVQPLDASARAAEVDSARKTMAGLADYTNFTRVEAHGLATFTVKTKPLEKISFGGRSTTYMESMLNSVDEYFSPDPGYAGIAIHAFTSWSEMFR